MRVGEGMSRPDARTRQERELKFALGAPLDEARERLQELGAEMVADASLERNWVFDRRDELFASGRLLRLRVDAGGARLTYKGPPRFEEGLKVRDELETEVGDAETLRSLLARLGYHVVQRYEKLRESWRLDGTLVALDHTPLGDFVEFENGDAVAVAERCGFDPRLAERRSYLRLWEDHRREDPRAPRDMVFEGSGR